MLGLEPVAIVTFTGPLGLATGEPNGLPDGIEPLAVGELLADDVDVGFDEVDPQAATMRLIHNNSAR